MHKLSCISLCDSGLLSVSQFMEIFNMEIRMLGVCVCVFLYMCVERKRQRQRDIEYNLNSSERFFEIFLIFKFNSTPKWENVQEIMKTVVSITINNNLIILSVGFQTYISVHVCNTTSSELIALVTWLIAAATAALSKLPKPCYTLHLGQNYIF